MNGLTLRRLVPAILVALATMGVAPTVALGLDEYTLPFYDPNIPLSYGFDRDRAKCVQLDYTGQVWPDCMPHWGRVYDQHLGLDFPMSVGTDVAAARAGTVVAIEEGFGTWEHGPFGNFVRLRHADGRDTLYYHLAQDGALVGVGATVLDGARVGLSGCSGICSGAHLHFEMLQQAGGVWQSIDPMSERLWTTWPGRVPFRARYVRESNSGTVVVKRGQTVTHWVEFQNTGGRPWRNDIGRGKLYMGTWMPAGHTSPYHAADWPYSWVPTAVDSGPVGPGATGRFTFGIRGPWTTGSYIDRFNLFANSVRWFDWDALGRYYIPVYVIANEPQ